MRDKFLKVFNLKESEIENDKNFILYKERLDHELSIIIKMKYSSYFLIVSDYIKWAKENDIPVIPIITVRRIPPILLVSTSFSPKPPNRSHAAINGNAPANNSQYFLPGSFSLRTPTIAKISIIKERLTLHFSVSGYHP